MNEILEALKRIEAVLDTLVNHRQPREWYDTEAAAEFLSRSTYTVRKHCCHGRILAEKRPCGRGKSKEWMISHGELLRIQAEGLRPASRPARPR